MVAVDDSVVLDAPRFRIGNFSFISLSLFTAAVAALVTLATLASEGFSENGFRLASQMAWRFAFFVFFAALVAGPLCRLVPLGLCRSLGSQRRQLVWSFCAAFAVYLLSIFLPNLLLAPTVYHEGLTGGMMAFVVLSGGLAAIMAFTASPQAGRLLGRSAQRAMLASATTYFWVSYGAIGLARISGPHRPDAFYGVSVCLMVAALLLRFAERFVTQWMDERPAV